MSVNLKSGLLVYSRLDSTSAFIDGALTTSYWTNNDVTFIGATGFNQNCAYFDANTDYLQRASFPELPTTHTISFWCINPVYIIKADATTSWYYRLTYESGKLKLLYDVNGNLGTYYSTAVTLSSWSHILITKQAVDAFGVTANIYVNGVDKTDQAGSSGVAGAISSSTFRLNYNASSLGLLGLGVWNRKLNAEEIAVLYNKGISYPFNDSKGAIAMYF